MSAVFVEKDVQTVTMLDCTISGHFDEGYIDQDRNTRYGHSGITLSDGVRGARIERVRIKDLSNVGIVAHIGVTAYLHRINLEHIKATGVWLAGAGSCTLDAVEAVKCVVFGIYVDAIDVCTLTNCSARESGTGFAFDHPNTLIEENKATLAPALLTTPHNARGCRSLLNEQYGVLTTNGAAVDLRDARIEHNGLNALRVEYAARRNYVTARILLAGAHLLHNGRGDDVRLPQREDAAVAAERGWVGGPSLRHMVDAAGVIMRDNGADEVVDAPPDP